MIYLAIDTSATAGSIALYKNDKIVFVHYTDIQITHSERLMPQIEQAFKINHISPSEIDAVLLSNGPGSFTGIRIGLATAKGICIAHNIPLIPFNTLEMLAVIGLPFQKPILSIIDAKMNEIYTALYGEDLYELISPKNCNLDELIQELVEKKMNDIFVTGDCVDGLEEKLKQHHIRYSLPYPHQNLNIASQLFTVLDIKKYPIQWDLDAASSLEPFYLRSPIAQINRKVGV